MSNNYNSFRLKTAILLSFLIVSIISGFSQGKTEMMISPKDDTIIIQAIPIQEINKRFEENNIRFNNTREIIKQNKDIHALDTIVRYTSDLLNKELLRIKDEENQLTIRNIDDLKRQWGSYDEVLKKWQITITARIVELEKESFEITKISKTWKLTKTIAIEQKSPQSTIERIDEIMGRSNRLEKVIKFRQDSVLILQNEITDFQIQVTETLSTLNEKRKALQSEYFIQDSRAIWHTADSTVASNNLRTQFKDSLKQNAALLKTFFTSNNKKIRNHLIIAVLLILLFYSLYYSSKSTVNTDDEKADRKNYIILSKFYASGLIVAFVLSFVIYSNIPAVIREFIQLLMLIPALLLIPKLVDRKLLRFFYYLVGLFLFDEFLVFFKDSIFSVRIMALAEIIGAIWLIIAFTNQIKRDFNQRSNTLFSQVVVIMRPIYLGVLVFSALSNIFGYVNLSTILLNTTITSIFAAVLLSLLIVITHTFFNCLFNTRLFQFSNIIKQRGPKLLLTIQSIINYLTIFIWVRAVLITLGLADQFGNWIMGIMEVKWEFRSAVISFGGIIYFFLVILVTSLLTKFLKVLLEEEIFPRIKLARGVPGAISMVVSYTVVAFGIYIAITAIGIDLSKFGFIAGALGVGIGFGLQGVVYNFIAGLILAFERPIQKGDTIEIGTLMGDVTKIGVRASTVRTYDGSEVIVPNGNLISNDLINWTLTDRKRRRTIAISVAYGTKPGDVMELLFKIASDHPEVLSFPKPWPLFDSFGDNGLNFKILFWVDFDRGLTVQSEVAMNIYDAFEKAGINIPFPQQDLYIKSFDPTVQKIIFPGSDSIKK